MPDKPRGMTIPLLADCIKRLANALWGYLTSCGILFQDVAVGVQQCVKSRLTPAAQNVARAGRNDRIGRDCVSSKFSQRQGFGVTTGKQRIGR